MNIVINRDKNLGFNRHIRPEPIKSHDLFNEYCLNRDKNLEFDRNMRPEPVKPYDFINEHSSSFSKRKTGCGFEPIPSNYNTIEQFYQNYHIVGNSTLSKTTPVINKPPKFSGIPEEDNEGWKQKVSLYLSQFDIPEEKETFVGQIGFIRNFSSGNKDVIFILLISYFKLKMKL